MDTHAARHTVLCVVSACEVCPATLLHFAPWLPRAAAEPVASAPAWRRSRLTAVARAPTWSLVSQVVCAQLQSAAASRSPSKRPSNRTKLRGAMPHLLCHPPRLRALPSMGPWQVESRRAHVAAHEHGWLRRCPCHTLNSQSDARARADASTPSPQRCPMRQPTYALGDQSWKIFLSMLELRSPPVPIQRILTLSSCSMRST